MIMSVPGGSIRYYPNSGRFSAFCECEAHSGAKVCRREKRIARTVGDGRPLGFLMAWLAHGHEFEDKESHLVAGAFFDWGTRKEHRDILRGLAGSAPFFEAELAPSDGQPDEPLTHP